MSRQLVEQVLQHAGKKGMKWGVRKNLKKAGIIINKSLNVIRERRKAQLNKVHERNKNKKFYSKRYKRNLKITKGNHEKAVQLTNKNVRDRNTKIIIGTVIAARVIRAAATRPETIRMGKNIIQAFKGSPIRYVDGSKFKNVIDITRVVAKSGVKALT